MKLYEDLIVTREKQLFVPVLFSSLSRRGLLHCAGPFFENNLKVSKISIKLYVTMLLYSMQGSLNSPSVIMCSIWMLCNT